MSDYYFSANLLIKKATRVNMDGDKNYSDNSYYIVSTNYYSISCIVQCNFKQILTNKV